METLKSLRDVANGKRRRFFNVSSDAVALFKKWLADYQAASTLEEVLDEWHVGHELDKYLRPRVVCNGKRLQVKLKLTRPRAPWEGAMGTQLPPPYNPNREFIYLILSFLTTPRCGRLRLCPKCEEYFIARRPTQELHGKCGRKAASLRLGNKNYEETRKSPRVKACRAAYAKYLISNRQPQNSDEIRRAAEYVLREANKHLPSALKIGGSGPKGPRINFITRNAEEIGIPKGEQ